MGFIKELCMNAESAAIYQIINNLHSKCIYKLKWPGLNKQEKGRETNHRPGILDNNRSCVQLCIRLAGIIFIGFSCFHTAQFCNQISSSSFHAPSAHLHLQFHDLKYGMNDSSSFFHVSLQESRPVKSCQCRELDCNILLNSCKQA